MLNISQFENTLVRDSNANIETIVSGYLIANSYAESWVLIEDAGTWFLEEVMGRERDGAIVTYGIWGTIHTYASRADAIDSLLL